jgi:hypothetical protein
MKPLAAEFQKGKFIHKLIKREGDVAIYSRKAPNHQDEHYEVVVIQKHEAGHRFGMDFEAAEGYPPSEAWGTSGWTYNHLPMAELRFKNTVEALLRAAGAKSQRFLRQTRPPTTP